jgi:hypothetical protein
MKKQDASFCLKPAAFAIRQLADCFFFFEKICYRIRWLSDFSIPLRVTEEKEAAHAVAVIARRNTS